MAGLVAKSFGALFLVPGIVLAAVGIVAAVAGWSELNEVFAEGPNEGDEERAEANAYLGIAGLAGIAIGGIAATIGAILIVIGRGRERTALASVASGRTGTTPVAAPPTSPSATVGPDGKAATGAPTKRASAAAKSKRTVASTPKGSGAIPTKAAR